MTRHYDDQLLIADVYDALEVVPEPEPKQDEAEEIEERS